MWKGDCWGKRSPGKWWGTDKLNKKVKVQKKNKKKKKNTQHHTRGEKGGVNGKCWGKPRGKDLRSGVDSFRAPRTGSLWGVLSIRPWWGGQGKKKGGRILKTSHQEQCTAMQTKFNQWARFWGDSIKKGQKNKTAFYDGDTSNRGSEWGIGWGLNSPWCGGGKGGVISEKTGKG